MVKVLFQNTCWKWFSRKFQFIRWKSFRPTFRLLWRGNSMSSVENTRQSTLELVEASGIPKLAVQYNLKKIGMVNCYDVSVSHILTEKIRWLELQHVFPCLYDTRSCHFWTVSSQEIINGSLTTLWNKKEAGHCQVNPVKLSIGWTLSKECHVIYLLGL